MAAAGPLCIRPSCRDAASDERTRTPSLCPTSTAPPLCVAARIVRGLKWQLCACQRHQSGVALLCSSAAAAALIHPACWRARGCMEVVCRDDAARPGAAAAIAARCCAAAADFKRSASGRKTDRHRRRERRECSSEPHRCRTYRALPAAPTDGAAAAATAIIRTTSPSELLQQQTLQNGAPAAIRCFVANHTISSSNDSGSAR